jgi:hypothetical protein
MTSNQHFVLLLTGIITIGVAVSRMSTAQQGPSQTSPANLRAQSMEIVDKAGRVRIKMATDSDGQPWLAFIDQNGKFRMKAAIGRSGDPLLAFLDADGTPRTMMLIDPQNTAAVLVSGPNGGALAGLQVMANGQVDLQLKHPSAKRFSASLQIGTDGMPGLRMLTPDEKSLASLWMNDKGTPTATLTNSGGSEVIVTADPSTTGFSAKSAQGRNRADMLIVPGLGSGITLQDAQGRKRGISTNGDVR